MLKLSSKDLKSLGPLEFQVPAVRRISTNPDYVLPLRKNELFLGDDTGTLPPGFAGYLVRKPPACTPPPNTFLIGEELVYLADGDVIRLDAVEGSIRSLYRKQSPHNSLLLTERCNNLCIMCSQPPRRADDSHLVDELLTAISLFAPETRSIGITGGEPTLLGSRFFDLIRKIKAYLPNTSLHVLSNGRRFSDPVVARELASVDHPDLMIGIPLYSDLSNHHDYIVQAAGAFNETIRGICNLKSVGVKVEIRVVIHRETFQRLPALAHFIRRNLTFCNHVALMGLELMGFAKTNLERLWIDPVDYRLQLQQAVEILIAARIPVSIYNHQLCLLEPTLFPFAVRSISDWKNEYMPECQGCTKTQECGGFFSSAAIRRSAHIHPFTT